MLGKEVSVHIDREVQTGRISSHQLMSTKKKADQVADALRALESAKSFQEAVQGLAFKEAMIHAPDDGLRVEVFFAFQDEGEMLSQLGIEKDSEERLRFSLAEKEEYLEGNGGLSNGIIRWEDDVRKLHFKLKGMPIEEGSAVELKGEQ